MAKELQVPVVKLYKWDHHSSPGKFTVESSDEENEDNKQIVVVMNLTTGNCTIKSATPSANATPVKTRTPPVNTMTAQSSQRKRKQIFSSDEAFSALNKMLAEDDVNAVSDDISGTKGTPCRRAWKSKAEDSLEVLQSPKKLISVRRDADQNDESPQKKRKTKPGTPKRAPSTPSTEKKQARTPTKRPKHEELKSPKPLTPKRGRPPTTPKKAPSTPSSEKDRATKQSKQEELKSPKPLTPKHERPPKSPDNKPEVHSVRRSIREKHTPAKLLAAEIKETPIKRFTNVQERSIKKKLESDSDEANKISIKVTKGGSMETPKSRTKTTDEAKRSVGRPRKILESIPETPKACRTPRRRYELRQKVAKVAPAFTPTSKTKRKLQALQENEDTDSESSESEEDESEETDNEEEAKSPDKTVKSRPTPLTPDKRWTQLKLKPQELHGVLNSEFYATLPHAKEKQTLFEKLYKKFPKWKKQLSEGFNILLHGLGSKFNLVNKFVEEMLEEEMCVVVNGFFPGTNIKEILNTITEDLLDITRSFPSPLDQVKCITDTLVAKNRELYVIIHNIDGVTLQGSKTQSVLSQLAQCSNVYVLATIDHVNAPLMWDHNNLARFNWIWVSAVTFEPYLTETSFIGSLMGKDGKETLASLECVWKSSTNNSKSVFLLLAEEKLKSSGDGPNYQGMPFNRLYKEARKNFFANSEPALSAHLTEFKDHKLIKFKKGQDGVEYLSVAINSVALKEFVEEHRA